MNRMLLLAALVAASPAYADSPRPFTFREAIDTALAQNPDIVTASAKVTDASSKVDELKDRRLPSARLDFDGKIYKEPYVLDFLGTPFTLYERETSTFVATVSQPLTGFAYLSELVGAAGHTANASKADYDKTRLDVAYRTAEAYLRALEARAGLDVARTSAGDIASELSLAEKLRAAGTYTDIDVLRFKSAKAAADQAVVRADADTATSAARLVVAMGLRDGVEVSLSDDLPPAAPPLVMSVDQAQKRAASARPELVAARERIAAANNTRRSAYEGYLPDVRAVGAYIHTTGVQPFQPADAEYVGLTVSWNVWDWGATQAKVQQAASQQAVATSEAVALVDRVALDVRTHWLDAKAGFDNLATARTQVEAAEEAMRLQRVRFEAGAATTTDVLDAEAEVARGRLRDTLARYDYYLALVGLARAMGDVPSAVSSGPP